MTTTPASETVHSLAFIVSCADLFLQSTHLTKMLGFCSCEMRNAKLRKGNLRKKDAKLACEIG